MNTKPHNRPSIFNDVMGPVMRGPSSSHTAASWRIAATCIELTGEPVDSALIEFDKDGIWASNYEEQGTVLGLSGGLLKIAMTDDSITRYNEAAEREGIPIHYMVSSFFTDHPNTVRLTIHGKSGRVMQFIAVSTGGGMFEIRSVNDFKVSIRGDFYELLVFAKKTIRPSEIEALASLLPTGANIVSSIYQEQQLIQIKSPVPFGSALLKEIGEAIHDDSLTIASANPVLPVVSGRELDYPFSGLNQMMEYADNYNLSLGDLGLLYEKSRSGLEEEILITYMKDIINTVDLSIENGLNGTNYPDRILHRQSDLIAKAEADSAIQSEPLINSIISNITAIMETKSSMGTIVAIPTAGSCGTFGGAIKAFSDRINSSGEEKVKAYFAGGLVGVLFAEGPGFSAEQYGCQVETGIASAMAAAALTELSGGSARQAASAASMAMQNLIGLVCDPVADRVEVPCLGKNISAAMNALSSHIMAMSGFNQVIPLNEVIDTVEAVGNLLPPALRCTGKGGLAVTPASVRIKGMLKCLK
jgi:L-serine dehydratase